ncbi:MAG: hypothetical protein ACYCUM_06175 [Solirubrobacteraceae bacterium]
MVERLWTAAAAAGAVASSLVAAGGRARVASGRLSRGAGARGAAPVALVVLVVLGGALPASSVAGTYRVYSCRIPTGGREGAPAPLETVEGATPKEGAWSRLASGDAEYANTCGSGGSLMAALEAGAAHSTLDTMTWEYTAPAGESIVKATLWRAGDAEGGAGYLFWLAGGHNPSLSELLSSEYLVESCAYSLGCEMAVGLDQRPLASQNRVAVPAHGLGGSHLYVNAACSLESCGNGAGDEKGNAVVAYVYATEMELEETAAPVVSSVAGELVTGSTFSGEAGLEFLAQDAGSGVYQTIVEVDGSVLQRSTVDEAGGHCVPVAEPGAATGAFLYPQPCPRSVDGHVALDTTKLAEGEHALRVLVTNAAGNETPVLERKIDVESASAPRGGGEGKGAGEASGAGTSHGGNGSASTGSASAQSGAAGGASALVSSPPGASIPATPAAAVIEARKPNGSPASVTARLEAGWSGGSANAARRRRLSGGRHARRSGTRDSLLISYGGRARLAGRLETASRRPIVGARVQVDELPAYGGAHSVTLGSARTGRDGRFSFALPAHASSGRILLSYASTIGGTPSASKRLALAVSAGVRLRVAPRRAVLGGTIRLSGKVLGGPIPHGGKEVVLEARSSGTRWLQFDVLRTKADGRFDATHRFRLPGPIRYSFRAVCPGEADFPYGTGASRAVGVSER